MEKQMSYLFQIEPWMLPLLMPFQVTQDQAYVAVEGDKLHVKMGRLFDELIEIETIKQVSLGKWPIWGGLGHRIGLKHDMAVLASTKNVVKIHFKTAQPLKAIGPVYLKVHDFYLALQEPQDFIDEMNSYL
jgi:hypothetical protein